LKPNPNRPPLAMFVILIVSSKLKNVSVQTSISCRRALNSGTAIVLAVLTITFFGIMLSATAVRAELERSVPRLEATQGSIPPSKTAL